MKLEIKNNISILSMKTDFYAELGMRILITNIILTLSKANYD